MMTDRDLQVGLKAAADAATKLGLALPHDQAKALAAAVIVHVDAARSPAEVGSDVLINLLRPHFGDHGI